MQFLLSWFLGDFDDDDEHDANEERTTGASSLPPQSSEADFERTCQAIEQKHSSKSLDFTYQYVNFVRLARSLACSKTTLQVLSLQETMISKPSKDIDFFFRQGIGRNKSLVSLNLTGNPLSEHGAIFLLQASIQDHPTLKILTLARCRLQDNAIITLGKLGKELHELDLSSNGLNRFDSLHRILLENTLLETLDLSCNRLGDDNDGLTLQSLFGVQDTNTVALRTLKLSRNQLQNTASAQKLCRILLRMEHLVDLQLGWNEIGNHGVGLLANSLIRIQKVDLTNCKITAEGALQLAKVFRHHHKNKNNNEVSVRLKELCLAHNDIGDEGVEALVMHETPIQVLDIQRTNFTGKHYNTILSVALANNTNLYRLIHTRNPIGNKTITQDIDFWTGLNSSGRRKLVMPESNVPLGLWPHIFETSKDEPSVSYFLLRQKPEICLALGSTCSEFMTYS